MRIVAADDRKGLGAALSQARAANGLTQRQLAALSGVPQGDISRIERGVKAAPLPMLSRIASALGQELSVALTPRV